MSQSAEQTTLIEAVVIYFYNIEEVEAINATTDFFALFWVQTRRSSTCKDLIVSFTVRVVKWVLNVYRNPTIRC